MLTTVERRPRIGVVQTKVRAAVDDERVVRQLRSDLGRGAVRKPQEDHVMTRERGGIGLAEYSVGERYEMGLVCGERTARVATGRQRADLDVRMAQQQAQHFAARVAARAGDGYGGGRSRHVRDYAWSCRVMQPAFDPWDESLDLTVAHTPSGLKIRLVVHRPASSPSRFRQAAASCLA